MPWRATRRRRSRCCGGLRALGGDDARVNQNLALVLGLQGKYDEAKVAIARDLPPDRVASNVDYLQQIVKVGTEADAGNAGRHA